MEGLRKELITPEQQETLDKFFKECSYKKEQLETWERYQTTFKRVWPFSDKVYVDVEKVEKDLPESYYKFLTVSYFNFDGGVRLYIKPSKNFIALENIINLLKVGKVTEVYLTPTQAKVFDHITEGGFL